MASSTVPDRGKPLQPLTQHDLRRIRAIRRLWLIRVVVRTFLLIVLCALLLLFILVAVVAASKRELPAAGIALAIVVGLAVVIVVLERPWRYAVAMYRDRRRGEATLIQARADMIRNEIFLDELGRTPEEHARAVAETAGIMEGVAAERIRREEQRIRLQEQAKEQRRRRDQQLAESAAIDLMTGTEFENYVAARLRLAGWTVSMTAATGDFGVDVIAERNGERVAVQCRRLGKVVGVGAVQQVVAGAMHHKCTRRLVVSNREFTRAAMQLARTHSCQLVGRAQLRTWTLE